MNEIAQGLKGQQEDLHSISHLKVQFSTYCATAFHAKQQRQITRLGDDRCLWNDGRDRSIRRNVKCILFEAIFIYHIFVLFNLFIIFLIHYIVVC